MNGYTGKKLSMAQNVTIPAFPWSPCVRAADAEFRDLTPVTADMLRKELERISEKTRMPDQVSVAGSYLAPDWRGVPLYPPQMIIRLPDHEIPGPAHRDIALQTSVFTASLPEVTRANSGSRLGAFFAHTGHSAAKLGLFLVAGALLDYRAGPPRNPRAEWEGVTMIERTHSVLVVILLLAISIGCQQRDATSGSDASAPSASDSDSALSQVVPKPVVTDVPAGTKVHIELLETLASNRNQAGDRVSGRVARDVVVAGSVAIPAGSEVSGVVTEAVGLKKIGGRARLGLKFTSVEPPSGSQSAIRASYLAVGKSETKKDAATIAGSAAGGAILGRILGHQKDKDARGTAIGGVVGAGVGTAVAAQTKGEEIVLHSGRVLHLTLQSPAQITVKG